MSKNKSHNDIKKQLGDDYYLYNIISQPLALQTTQIQGSKDTKIITFLKQHKTINVLAHPLYTQICYIWFDKIKTHNLILPTDKILIIANNGAALDTIIHYQKYENYRFNSKNIFIMLDNYDEKSDNKYTLNLITKNRITVIQSLQNNLPKFNFIFIDNNIRQSLEIVLNNLEINGNLFTYSPIHTNIQTYEQYKNIKQFFTTCYSNPTFANLDMNMFDNNLFIGYKGDIQISNISIDEYTKYCKKVKQEYKKQMVKLQELYALYLRPSNIPKVIQENLVYAIKYFKQIGFQVVDWLKDDASFNTYFYDTIIQNINDNTEPYVSLFKNTCNITLKLSNDIEYYYKDHIDNIYHISEDVYQYLEDIDIKQVELYFNNRQKTLQNFLKEEYDITIENRIVSRAWMKLYELYSETKYFDNLPTNITAFHICEAPGNFINASLYYAKNINKTYNWSSQSWKEGDIFDEYGFIRRTSSKWDFGINKNGNIMDLENFMYYYEMFGNKVDTLVGDCGIPYHHISSGNKKNLSVYQLIYGLIMPKVGGNFVIKTYATQYNFQFISLLNVALCYYEKLYIFRSSINIWSPEVYFVGINKKEFDQNILVQMVHNFENNIVTYPISKIDPDFSLAYEYHTQNVISMYIEIKKFFAYLTKHPEEFNKNKSNLAKLLIHRNMALLEKYFSKNHKEKYSVYIEKNNTL